MTSALPSVFHLAQVNVALARAEMDGPIMKEFVDLLAPINALADRSPGFVWRLQTEDGDATAVRPFEDDRILINLSVWESVAALREYVYRSAHADVMRRRREWFERFQDVYVALWWVAAGHRPTPMEAVERLDHLHAHGPTAFAFSFRHLFDPAGQPVEQSRRIDDCPVT
jgi:hypothetical protein